MGKSSYFDEGNPIDLHCPLSQYLGRTQAIIISILQLVKMDLFNTINRVCHLSNGKTLSCLGYIGDEILHS